MARHLDLNPWDLTPSEAIALQKSLSDRLIVEPLTTPVSTVAGTDLSFDKATNTVFAGIVVLKLPELEVVDQASAIAQASFPYVPGLLSFREIPPLLEAWKQLRTEPDAVMTDGHGYAHPRRFGLACHFGVVVDRPTLGCGKSVLVGEFEAPPNVKGAWTPLVHKGEEVGAALRTREGVSPIFVSIGNRIDLASAVALTMRTVGATRVPEPTRQAHLLVNRIRRGEE